MRIIFIIFAKIIAIILFFYGFIILYFYCEPVITKYFYNQIFLEKNPEEVEKKYNFFVSWYSFLLKYKLNVTTSGNSIGGDSAMIIGLAGEYVDAIKILPKNTPEKLQEIYKALINSCANVEVSSCIKGENTSYFIKRTLGKGGVLEESYLYNENYDQVGFYRKTPKSESGENIALDGYRCSLIVEKKQGGICLEINAVK